MSFLHAKNISKIMGRKILLLFAIISIFATNIVAQPAPPEYSGLENPKKGTITGKVYDENLKKPMEYTSIAVYSAADSSLITGTISDGEGNFILKNIPYGRYYIMANFMGYEKSFLEDISLSSDQPVKNIGVINLKAASQKLEEVEVVGTQNRIEYKIDRKVINVAQDLNATGGSAVDVLQNTPSVTVDIDGNVSLRGSTNFTVLIDGRPSPLAGNEALQQIPASAIQNIELITNPSAKYDPDGMAGIINIVMKKNSLQGLSGIFNTSVGTGSKYSGDFLLSYKTKKYNVFGGLNYQDNLYGGSVKSFRQMYPNQPVTDLVNIEGSRDRSREGLEFKSGIDFYLSENSTLSLGGSVGNHASNSTMRTHMRSYTYPASYDSFDISEGLGSRSGDYYNLNLDYTKKFDQPQHQLMLSLSYQGENGDDIDEENEYPADSLYNILASIAPSRVRSNEYGDELEFRANLDYTRPVLSNGLIETGYQMRLDKRDEYYLFENFDPDLNDWLNNPLYSSGDYFNRNIQSAYGTFSEKLGKFEFKAGLRGEYTNRKIRSDVNGEPTTLNRIDFFPSFHLSRKLAAEQQILASYSRRINRPDGWQLEPHRSYMNSYTLREGNPALKPEYVNSFELSYQKNFGKSFFVVESYYRNTQNLMTRVVYQDSSLTNVLVMTTTNINDDNSAGAEFMLNLSVKKWLTLNSSMNLYRYWLNGSLNGEDISAKSNNWDLRLNASFFINSKSRFQTMFMYNGPSVTAQGSRKAFYFANIAYRQDFLDRKLSATLSLQDVFGSMRHEFSTYTPDLINTVRFEREHQVIMLTLSYKLNNFKNQAKRSDDSQNMMDDSGVI
ncbi:MAG: TonB-dependent receptor [Bacteroidales bacterium]|nr:TonB-dependent receptor [Bacteroidales bacterium]